MSRLLIVIGLLIVAIGLLWPVLTRLGLGRLPGDVVVQRGNFSFYFPFVTCLVISVLLTALLWLFNR
jgi:membrane protein implicated in regulation of membrane protease activity